MAALLEMLRERLSAGLAAEVERLVAAAYWQGLVVGALGMLALALVLSRGESVKGRTLDLALLAAVSVLLWYTACHCGKPAKPMPEAPPAVTPAKPEKQDRTPRRADGWRGWLGAFGAERAEVGGRTDPKTGRPLQIDLPRDRHLKNLPDGGGCCVWASGSMAADWHRVKPLMGLLSDRLGGAGPPDVDRAIARRYPGYKSYMQAQGEPGVALMDWALGTGRVACVTYGYGERYGRTIAHMVCLVHLDSERACVLDCNFVGTYEWMSRGEFLRRWRLKGGGWCYVFVEPPPPPIPVNA